jgi:hypothetical protein
MEASRISAAVVQFLCPTPSQGPSITRLRLQAPCPLAVEIQFLELAYSLHCLDRRRASKLSQNLRALHFPRANFHRLERTVSYHPWCRFQPGTAGQMGIIPKTRQQAMATSSLGSPRPSPCHLPLRIHSILLIPGTMVLNDQHCRVILG